MKIKIPRVSPNAKGIPLNEPPEEVVLKEKEQKRRGRSAKRIQKLCDETTTIIEGVQQHRIFHQHTWRNLKLDLEKLISLLDRLNKELARQRKGKL